MKEQKRIPWIDLLETVAIFLVVLCHVATYSVDFLAPGSTPLNYFCYFFNTILSPCVPLFFLANGYLLFSKKLDLKKHSKKILKLIFLMVIWGAITISLLQVRYNTYIPLKEYLHDVWYTKERWTNFLWFMGMLVCVYIFFPLLKTTFDRNKRAFLWFVVIMFAMTFGLTLLNQLLSVVRVGALNGSIVSDKNFFGILNPFRGIKWWCFVYFCLGGVIYHYKDCILQISAKTRNLVAITGIILSCCSLFCYGLFASFSSGKVYSVVAGSYDTISTFINTCCIFLLCLNYKGSNRLIRTISCSTLGIYLINPALDNLLPRPTVAASLAFPYSIARALVVLILALVINLLIKKIPVVRKILL